MISRKNRFHGYNSLRHVYKYGRTVRSQITALKYLPNRQRDEYRLAVVVSKKVHKSAVTRNRIRRRLYEAVRRHESGMVEPFDMVLTVYHEQLAHMPADELEGLVVGLLRQAGILKKKV